MHIFIAWTHRDHLQSNHNNDNTAMIVSHVSHGTLVEGAYNSNTTLCTTRQAHLTRFDRNNPHLKASAPRP